MKKYIKIFLPIIAICGLFGFWYWTDNNDYFQTNYNDLTAEQNKLFHWQDDDSTESLENRYRQHFIDKEFAFPRQQISKIKIFKNIPIIGIFTCKTLKKNYNDSFIKFCNDTTNFHWGETTWGLDESEYYIRLYNDKNKVIGKIYFCLKDCGMTSARPLCPSMKFGGLTNKGLTEIGNLINNNAKWE